MLAKSGRLSVGALKMLSLYLETVLMNGAEKISKSRKEKNAGTR